MSLRVTLLVKKLDVLIDWYTQNKPSVQQVAVNMCPDECREFANESDGEFTYRGKTIIPKNKNPVFGEQ